MDSEKYITAWRRRVRLSREADRRRAQRAWEVSRRCARLLVEEFGAKRVYLFGSLAEDLFRGTSDIDLVVEGLATDVYFKALSRISCLSREFQIDLIPLEEYRYKQELCEKGILLYESRRSKSAAAPAGGSAEGIR